MFCIARSNLVGELNASGLDVQHPLSVFRHSPDLCAVVSEVALKDFCGPEAELCLQELGWIGPRAVNHEAVVEEVMACSPVLPARFGTLFSSQEKLRKFLDVHGEIITHYLDRIRGRSEWSVKGLLHRKQAQQALLSKGLTDRRDDLAVLPPGTRYFEERRIQQEADKEFTHWLNQTCREVAGDLQNHASDFCECEKVPRERQENGVEEVLNWAFLLPEEALPAFRESIRRMNFEHGPQGLRFELSGPWPPYRFVPPLSMDAVA